MTQEMNMPVVANDNALADIPLSPAISQLMEKTHDDAGGIVELTDFESSQTNPLRFYLSWVASYVRGLIQSEPGEEQCRGAAELTAKITKYRARRAAANESAKLADVA